MMRPAYPSFTSPGPEVSPEPGTPIDIAATGALLSEQAFKALADFIPHIVWTTGPNGVLDYCNRRFYEYTGIRSDGTTLQDDWSNSIHPGDLEPAHQRWKECIRTGDSFEVEIRVRRSSDRCYRWHLARAVPLYDETQKHIVKWFGTCIDIEEQKQAAARSAFQTRVSVALGSSLEVRETLAQIARLCVPELADWCRIDVIDENGRMRTEVVAHRDPEKERLLKQVVGRRQAAHKQPVLVPDPQDRNVYEAVGYGSAFTVPLVGHNRMLGAFMLVSCDPARAFSDDERNIAEELGRRAGVAIENSQIFEREHRIAETLQRALLPSQLPSVPAITLDWEYRPATQESQVGGDWYDAFLMPDGSLFISIGDVCGHGLEAAVAMSTLRQSLRSLAFECPEPWLVLEGINRILQCEQNETLATALFARFDPRTLRLEYASAGHPAPILMDGRNAPRVLPAGGTPLGILALGGEIARHTVDLEHGSILLFYTDGLIEFSRDVMREEERLLRVMSELSPHDRNPAGAVVNAMLANSLQSDDIAVLTLQTEEHPLHEIDVSLPCVPSSSPIVRRLMRRFARAHALDDNECFRLLTACGEAIANAAEYAYDESSHALRVTTERRAGVIEVMICDGGGKRRAPEQDLDRGRGLLLMRALSNDVRIEKERGGTTVRLRFHG
jgi:PAS domain S-box-containing protein